MVEAREKEAPSVLIFVINEHLGDRLRQSNGERPVTANPHHK